MLEPQSEANQPRRSLLIRCLREVWKRAGERTRLGEYLSVTSQVMVESRNDRAENAWGLRWRQNAIPNNTLWSAHFGVVVVELINSKCGGIVRNEIL